MPKPGLKYQYTHPEGTQHSDSPFDSFWFVSVGSHPDDFGNLDLNTARAELSGCEFALSVDELRQRGLVPLAKRLNPKQRRKMAKKRQREAQSAP